MTSCAVIVSWCRERPCGAEGCAEGVVVIVGGYRPRIASVYDSISVTVRLIGGFQNVSQAGNFGSAR